jgi:hypothetical protein
MAIGRATASTEPPEFLNQQFPNRRISSPTVRQPKINQCLDSAQRARTPTRGY